MDRNPVMVLWNGSLAFLGLVLHFVLFPALVLVTLPIAALVFLARRARRQRETRYSWAVPTSATSKSGYARLRYGRFH